MKIVYLLLMSFFCAFSSPLFAEDLGKNSNLDYAPQDSVNSDGAKMPSGLEKEGMNNSKSYLNNTVSPSPDGKGLMPAQPKYQVPVDGMNPTQAPSIPDAARLQRSNDLFPYPTAEECAAYRRRADQIQDLLRRRDYTPLTPREESRSQWCEEQAHVEAQSQAEERARAQQEVDRASQACISLRTEIQRTVDERNAAAQECSRHRQACLQAEDAYQGCVHDGGTSFLGFITFGAVNCNSEHDNRDNVCSYYTADPTSPYRTISELRRLNCEAFNAQSTNDSICGSRLNYYESNCAATHGNLESDSRLAWYCERYVR